MFAIKIYIAYIWVGVQKFLKGGTIGGRVGLPVLGSGHVTDLDIPMIFQPRLVDLKDVSESNFIFVLEGERNVIMKYLCSEQKVIHDLSSDPGKFMWCGDRHSVRSHAGRGVFRNCGHRGNKKRES